MGKLVDAHRSVSCPHAMAGNQVTLKVTPQELSNRSIAIRNFATRIQIDFQNMTQAISRTQGYWNGEAADLHRSRYQEMVPEVEEMLRTLKQHAENLENIAQTYQTSEAQVVGISEQLPKNAIE